MMWFKQAQFFRLPSPFSYKLNNIQELLKPFSFKPCSSWSLTSSGWIAPFDSNEALLVHDINNYLMICLQIEEKILPTVVVQQELKQTIKELEIRRNTKVYQKEKQELKDEIIHTLLPKAFSKFTKVYAYIDSKNHWLIINSTKEKVVNQFIVSLKKTINKDIVKFDIKKLAPIMTKWLLNNNAPSPIEIEKNCVLQDPNQQNRTIRCQQQDLFAKSIQPLIQDRYEVKQLALSWDNEISFLLTDDLSIRNIQFQDKILTSCDETEQEKFDADFIIVAETLTALLKWLLKQFGR